MASIGIPYNPSQLTVGGGISSVAGLSQPHPSSFSAAPGTSIGAFTANTRTPQNPFTPSLVNYKPPTSPVTQKPVGNPGAADTTPTVGTTAATTAAPQDTTMHPTGDGGYTTNTEDAPQKFVVDTKNVSSDALTTPVSGTDVTNHANSLAEYARQLSEASGYNPDYLDAYNRAKSFQQQQLALQGQYAADPSQFGSTVSQAEAYLSREMQGLAAAGGQANIALQTQELRRQGDMNKASVLLNHASQVVSPGSTLLNNYTGQPIYSGLGGYQAVQAAQSVSDLARNFPDANISPTDSLEVAQQKASSAPSFQSRNLVSLGNGAFVNKNQIVTDPTTGFSTVVTPAQAAQAEGYTKAITENQINYGQTQSAITTADKNFPLLLEAAKKANVNNGAPLQNQLEQAAARKLIPSESLASFNTMVASLQTEYSRILARGGSFTDADKRTSQALIDGTYSLKQLQAVYDTVKKEGANVLAGYQSSIDSAKQGLNQIYRSAQSLSPGGAAGTVTWDAL